MATSALSPLPSLAALGTVVLGAGLTLAACKSVSTNSDHCSNNEGDVYCAELFPEQPLCSAGSSSSCNVNFPYGCVAAEDLADGCHDPCGTRNSSECEDPTASSSGSDSGSSDSGDPSTTTDVATDSGTTTTGPIPCSGPEDCTDPTLPVCGDDGECVPCGDAPNPQAGDEACAAADAATPLCVAEVGCVACRGQQTEVCDDDQLVCDEATFECVPCTAHDQCDDVGACQLATGECFPSDSLVVSVDGDEREAADFTSIQAAITAVADEGFGVITIAQLGAGGEDPYLGALLIDGGKTIALLAADDENPRVLATAGSGLSVQGPGTAAYVDQLTIRGSAQYGVRADGSMTWIDRSRLVANDGGGLLAENAASVTLRTSMVGDGSGSVNAIEVNGASLEMVYSTVVTEDDNFSAIYALQCTAPVEVNIRNSLLVSLDDPMAEIDCSEATVTNSAGQSQATGDDNIGLGAVELSWFADFPGSDFLLADPPMPLSTTATWQTGDPTVDINGDPRPTVDGTADYAGADLLP